MSAEEQAAKRRRRRRPEAWGLLAGLVYPPPFLEHRPRARPAPGGLRRPARARRAADDGRDRRASSHCDNSNVTGIVDVLEEKGLATRQPSPSRPPGEGDRADRRGPQGPRPADAGRWRSRRPGSRALRGRPAGPARPAPARPRRNRADPTAAANRVELTSRCRSGPAPTASRWPLNRPVAWWGRLQVEGLEACPRAGRC